MKKIQAYPPNIDVIRTVLHPETGAIFCYGDTLYNPDNRKLSLDVEAHEMVHSEQQGDNPDAWWAKYLSDREFRLDQELQAYGRQWLFAKEHVKDKKLLEWAKESMALALSGESYGSLIAYGEAESKIRNYAKQ